MMNYDNELYSLCSLPAIFVSLAQQSPRMLEMCSKDIRTSQRTKGHKGFYYFTHWHVEQIGAN